jgi:hypothetical protein
MNYIFLALSTTVVLLFSFVFYKTRDSPTSSVSAVSSPASSIYFVSNRKPQSQSAVADQSICLGGCSWMDGYAAGPQPVVDPYGVEENASTLPHDMQSLDTMNTMPFDYNGMAQPQSAFVQPAEITSTPDPVVDLIPQEIIY